MFIVMINVSKLLFSGVFTVKEDTYLIGILTTLQLKRNAINKILMQVCLQINYLMAKSISIIL